MNAKFWTGFGIVVVLVFSHYMAYRYGRESMRTEILSSPVVSDTTHGPPLPWKPPIHGEAPADPEPYAPILKPEPAGVSPSTIAGLLSVIDSLKGAVREKNLTLTSISRPMSKTISEYGSSVKVTAYPDTRRFSWDWIPAQSGDTILTTITNSQYVPMPEHDFWILGHLSLVGGGGTIGFKNVGIGRLMNFGAKSVTFLSVKVEF